MASRFGTEGIARASARRPWIVIGGWLVLIVLAALSAPALGSALTYSVDLLNSPPSVRGFELLEQRLRGPRPFTETVIIRSDTLTVDDPAFRARVEQVTTGLTGLSGIVAGAANYYQTGAATMVSADKRATIVPVTLAGRDTDAAKNAPAYVRAVEGLNTDPRFEVLTIGTTSVNDEFNRISEEDLQKGEGIGIPVALLILVVIFGALVAAGLPLVLSLVSIFVAIGLTALVGRQFEVSFFIVNMITMIGLAVGIDYALFVVERFREERRQGHAKLDAIAIAGGTASRAVFFSGLTVLLSLAGLFIVPNNIYRSLSLGAILVVLVAVAATLTLVPAMLSLLGDRINWPRFPWQPRPGEGAPTVAPAANAGEDYHHGVWGRISRAVMARPLVSIILSVGLLVACTLPFFQVEYGFAGASTLPESNAKRAYGILSEQFAAGLIAPVEIVVDGAATDPRVQAGVQQLQAALIADGAFGPATVQANPAGDLVLVSAPLTLDPSSLAAKDVIERLREQIVPQAFAGVPAAVLVTGETAFNVDFFQIKDTYTPVVFAFVLGLTFILLMLAFRSIVVPLKAVLINLLSVGAAYGLLVLVFQKGVGADFFGFQQVEAIEAWLPLFLFSVLFGLSMDYHIFLLSRIREHFSLTQRNAESVAIGLQSTGKIITGAALIMVVVFSGFAAGRLVSLQQTGFGLAVAVLLDATIVRCVLVPASMALLGDWNWYLPSWLKWLPDLRIEGGPTRVAPRAAAPAPAPGD